MQRGGGGGESGDGDGGGGGGDGGGNVWRTRDTGARSDVLIQCCLDALIK